MITITIISTLNCQMLLRGDGIESIKNLFLEDFRYLKVKDIYQYLHRAAATKDDLIYRRVFPHFEPFDKCC